MKLWNCTGHTSTYNKFGEVKDGFKESWPDAYMYEREVVVYVPNVLTTFVTHCRYNTSVNFLAKSEWVLFHYNYSAHSNCSFKCTTVECSSWRGWWFKWWRQWFLEWWYQESFEGVLATHNHALENDLYKCAIGKNWKVCTWAKWPIRPVLISLSSLDGMLVYHKVTLSIKYAKVALNPTNSFLFLNFAKNCKFIFSRLIWICCINHY